MLSGRIRLIAVIIVMIPVVIYLGLDEARQTRIVAPPPPNDAHQQSDYYIINGSIRDFSTSGSLHQHLESSQLEHQPALQQTLLVNPKLQIFDDRHPTKIATSETGIIADSNELVTLAGKVTLQDHPDPDQASTLKTESLLIYPKKEFAETADPVTLSNQTGTTTAVGMEIDSATGVIKLLSDVKGIHHVD